MPLILVTGGIRSGKSRFAEEYLVREGKEPWLYLPTAFPADTEMALRVERHLKERDPRFRTLNPLGAKMTVSDLFRQLDPYPIDASLLLDGMGLFLSGMLMEQQDESVPDLVEKVSSLISFLSERKGLTVVVTEETGLGGIPLTPLGRRFTDFLGEVNQTLSSRADSVYLSVAGCVIRLKAKPD
ncbi:MAG: bifunctional adenosylcobinamide kinase/adenosylcobinamide-phosphate guanylyltransferase [Leptospirales bacterium]